MQTMSDLSSVRLTFVTGLLFGILFLGGTASTAQQGAPPSQALATQVTLAEVVRNLPEYVSDAEKESAYEGAIQNATVAERDSALPKLMEWLGDQRPRVRGTALLAFSFLCGPSEKRPGPFISVPVQYIPAVAARLRDSDPAVRNAAFLAALTVGYGGGAAMDELTKLVVPMLREPDVLTEYPNPSFVEGRQRMLAGMTPEQQAEFKAMPHMTIKLPAEGPRLLWILAMRTRQPSAASDDAMIEFLDRKDQTKTTLADCLHTLALTSASERVNDEALRRVFEQKAMTIYLLQFVTNLRLTPEQSAVQKERLLALSNDESAHPALRRSARNVAACWNGERTGSCKPNDKDLSEQLDTR
jgi:hypothetical protein